MSSKTLEGCSKEQLISIIKNFEEIYNYRICSLCFATVESDNIPLLLKICAQCDERECRQCCRYRKIQWEKIASYLVLKLGLSYEIVDYLKSMLVFKIRILEDLTFACNKCVSRNTSKVSKLHSPNPPKK